MIGATVHSCVKFRQKFLHCVGLVLQLTYEWYKRYKQKFHFVKRLLDVQLMKK